MTDPLSGQSGQSGQSYSSDPSYPSIHPEWHTAQHTEWYTGPPPTLPGAGPVPPPFPTYPGPASAWDAPPSWGAPPPYPRPDQRPGSLLAAAILGYVTSGLLLLAAGLLFVGASLLVEVQTSTSDTAEFVFAGAANMLAAGLLIAGGAQMSTRHVVGRPLFCAGCGVVLATSIYWAARWTSSLHGLVVYAVLFAALVVIAGALAFTTDSTTWLHPRPPELTRRMPAA